jgi:predicted TIM-barrel fold metal-dependent hydrolase
LLARQLPVAIKIAQACPQVQFVLDHCGGPDVKGQALDPWWQDMRALAALPNVACKISGIAASADPLSWTTADLRPYDIEVFGWNRVVWGSDYPVCSLTTDLGRWVAAAQAIVKGASETDQSALFSRNAGRLYRLG